MNSTAAYILWLPSWYPNRFDPFNGDFIQRHAQATALYTLVTVIHFAAPGEQVYVQKSEVVVQQSEMLKEVLVYSAYKPVDTTLVDKVLYNRQFYKRAKDFLSEYFRLYGLPKLVHVHVPVKAGNIARWIKKTYGIAYIVSEHASHYMSEAENSYFKRHRLYKRQVAKVFQNAILVTNVSAAIGAIIQRLFKLEKVFVIHNTVNTSYFNFSDVKHPVFTFIHVSTFSEQKNVIGILRTFEKLLAICSDWKLQLVGPPTTTALEFVRQRHLQAYIEFTGEVAYEKVADYMKKAHVLVLFSRHENFPCVIAEALCCGIPVVAAAVAGVGEAVDDSNGVLVTSGNETELLQAVRHIKEAYDLYDQSSISQKAVCTYSYKTIGRQIFNLYYPEQYHAG